MTSDAHADAAQAAIADLVEAMIARFGDAATTIARRQFEASTGTAAVT